MADLCARSVPLLLVLALLTTGCAPDGEQLASTVEPPRTIDSDYSPEIARPAFRSGEGPRVVVDEAHNNFHTAVGTYAPFARVLERDGYVVERGAVPLQLPESGSRAVLVIADAQPPAAAGGPPTFSSEEVASLNAWVRGGGAVLLITDHMPDPGAIADLAASFGIEVHNGYASKDAMSGSTGPLVFGQSGDLLIDHPITRGADPSEAVTAVATFAGSAFRADPPFEPLLVFGPGVRSWVPDEYRQFRPTTDSIDVDGWYQGGVTHYGSGRLAMFAEAAMFTAQIFDAGTTRVGMNHELAGDNLRLLRNVMRWLTS